MRKLEVTETRGQGRLTLVAKDTSPSLVAYAREGLVTVAMGTCWVGETFVTQSALPSNSTAATDIVQCYIAEGMPCNYFILYVKY